MTKSSAKTKSYGNADPHSKEGQCADCGHAYHGEGACPPLPPAKKQVTVDEAVVANGGKPSTDFERSLSDALGDPKAKLKLAEENFDRHPGEPVALDLEISKLRPMKANPRGDELGDVSGLVKSMEMHGFIGSLFVRPVDLDEDTGEPAAYEVWAGNRRLKAAKEAGLKVLPCDVYELTEGQALELNMAEQIQRADLSPLQEGDACRRLMELQGYDERQVAEKFGKSTSWVTKRVALCGIAPELRKSLTKGTLPVTLANALAALPTHQQQVKAADALEARPDWEKRNSTLEADAEWIRTTQCRPLSDATWKLTDAELVPEVGACSACPHNSSNAKMPGLFDNVKAKPMCARVECFGDKALAAWLKRTEKHKAAGAKVLALTECKKLFARGNDLGSSSRYVEAGDMAPKDKQGRTWGELAADVAAEHRPQLHVAQDNGGKLRELYVADKLLEACATHLKLRWAKNVVEEAQERSDPKKEAARREESELKRRVEEAQMLVIDTVLGAAAKTLSASFTLTAARFLGQRVGERSLDRYREATGRKTLPKDWVEKGATLNELLALVWLDDATDELRNWGEFDERFLALAKTHGFDVKAMVAAQLSTAKAEAEKAK